MASKSKLLILGTGWGGTSFLRSLRNTAAYDITIASTRDHMLFTPLLASTATGALEHRSIIEPIRPLATQKNARFLNADAVRIEAATNRVHFEVPRFAFDMPNIPVVASADTTAEEQTTPTASSKAAHELDVTAATMRQGEAWTFREQYDVLVVAVGAGVNTFGVPGVQQHCLFMKEAQDARGVRKRMHDLFEAASLPVLNAHQRRALLTFVVCGAGPTGVELAAEIADLLHDMTRSKRYAGLAEQARVVLVEASGNILSLFDETLRSYALRRLRASRVEVKLGSSVKSVERNAVVLEDSSSSSSSSSQGMSDLQERLPCGMVVWTAGVGPRPIVAASDLPMVPRDTHIATDAHLLCDAGTTERAPVFAIGDCARIVNCPLVPIAQVAEQQGVFVASLLDASADLSEEGLRTAAKPFQFASKGMLAYVGAARGVAAVPVSVKGQSSGQRNLVRSSGFVAWAIWRFAYFSKLGSFRNKLQVPLDWVKTALFGRDVSSF